MSRVQESIQKIERQLILDRQSLAHMERTRPNRLKVRFGWGTWIRTKIDGVESRFPGPMMSADSAPHLSDDHDRASLEGWVAKLNIHRMQFPIM